MKNENRKSRRYRWVVIVLLLIILAVIGVSCTGQKKSYNDNSLAVRIDDNATPKSDEIEEILGDRRVFFAGIEDATISRDTIVQLSNPKDNDDIFIKYSVINGDTEDILFETDLVPPGEYVGWIPGESGLSIGETSVVFVETPYIEINGEWKTLTVGRNEAVLTLID